MLSGFSPLTGDADNDWPPQHQPWIDPFYK